MIVHTYLTAQDVLSTNSHQIAHHAGDTVLAADPGGGNIGPANPEAPPGSGKFQTLMNWFFWGVVATAGCAGLYAAVSLGWEKRQGGGGEAQPHLVKVLVSSVLIGVVVTIVNTLALT
ncbi:UNVERIFIED_CONTAM: hypothetical protein DES50_12313 [Williamsia faeni]